MAIRERIGNRVSDAVNKSFKYKITFNLILIVFIISFLSIGTFIQSVKESDYKPLKDKVTIHLMAPDKYLLEKTTMEVNDNKGMFMRLFHVGIALLLFYLVISTLAIFFKYAIPDSLGEVAKAVLAYLFSFILIMIASFITIYIKTGTFYFPLDGLLTWLANLAGLFKNNVTIQPIF